MDFFSIPAAEWKRKAVHAGTGLFALTLRWLDWKVAAGLALLGLLLSVFLMPRIGRGIYRDREKKRDAGIVSYAAIVLVLILLFRRHLEIAGAVWAMMAFGDPAAAVAGRIFGGWTLPWNPAKRLAGLLANVLVGAAAGILLFVFVSAGTSSQADAVPFGSVAASMVLAASLFGFLESLRAGIDDNLVAPLPTALVLPLLLFLTQTWGTPEPWTLLDLQDVLDHLVLAFGINSGVAILSWRLRLVSGSGAFSGAVVGFLILGIGGWGAYAVLWTFFAVGTLATKWGYRVKEARSVAQGNRGRRGVAHVLANCAVPTALIALGVPVSALLVFASSPSTVFLYFSAAFAAALADTLGTEIGALYGKSPFSPLSFQRLAVGTAGAVSWQGLVAGFLGAAGIGVVALLVHIVHPALLWVVPVSGLLGSLSESVLLDMGRRLGFCPDHDFANAFSTFVGALAAAVIGMAVMPSLGIDLG